MQTGVRRDLVGYGDDYPAIQWPNDARIAVLLVVHFEEGAELTPAEEPPGLEFNVEGYGLGGSAGARNLTAESMFEYGSRRGFWRLIELLDRHDIKATFFLLGQSSSPHFSNPPWDLSSGAAERGRWRRLGDVGDGLDRS